MHLHSSLKHTTQTNLGDLVAAIYDTMSKVDGADVDVAERVYTVLRWRLGSSSKVLGLMSLL